MRLIACSIVIFAGSVLAGLGTLTPYGGDTSPFGLLIALVGGVFFFLEFRTSESESTAQQRIDEARRLPKSIDVTFDGTSAAEEGRDQ